MSTWKILRGASTTASRRSLPTSTAPSPVAAARSSPRACLPILPSLLGCHSNNIVHACWFSESAAAAKKTASSSEDTTGDAKPPQAVTFSSPRVKALYERMIQMHPDQVSLVGNVILEMMGKPAAPDEFYYHGMGRGGGGGKAGAAQAAAAEEPAKRDVVDLKLVGFDEKSKIKVIKEVRALAGLGLKEAKELVESAPKIIHKALKMENAEELKAKLEAAGAQIELV